MDLYTVEEHTLARDIADKSLTLVNLALANNDVALHNILNDLINIAFPRLNDKAKNKKRQYESVVSERTTRESAVQIADAIVKSPKSCLKVAQNLIKLKTTQRDVVKYFKDTVGVIKQKLGLSEGLDETKTFLRQLIEADEEKQDKKKALKAPSKDRDIGEILYHLDMSTRHLDVLVDYALIAAHAGEVTSIASSIQELAQRIRTELEAARTPYDEQHQEEETPEKAVTKPVPTKEPVPEQ